MNEKNFNIRLSLPESIYEPFTKVAKRKGHKSAGGLLKCIAADVANGDMVVQIVLGKQEEKTVD